jgi:hypothetical protein
MQQVLPVAQCWGCCKATAPLPPHSSASLISSASPSLRRSSASPFPGRARTGALPLLLLRLTLPWPRPHRPSPPPGHVGVDLRGRRPPHRRGKRPPRAAADGARPPRPITGSPAPPLSLQPRLAPARGLQQHGILSAAAIGAAATLDSLDPVELQLRPRPLRWRGAAAADARSSPPTRRS